MTEREPDYGPAVDLRNVSKRFGAVTAVADISAAVARGEALCLFGPSGCGKTTLLRIIAGLERPDNGTVRINGIEATGPAAFMPPARRNIGMVFQDLALWPHMTAERHLDFVLRGATRLERADRQMRVAAFLEAVSLADRRRSYPAELSGGQQQRLAIARAMVHAPSILLLDEPFANLDIELRDDILAFIQRFKNEKAATILFATHDPGEAKALADRILDMGRRVNTTPNTG